MGSNLDRLRKTNTCWLLLVFMLAMLLRITPSLKYGLPYGFDIYEFTSRILVLNEGKHVSMPHGPLFYYVQLAILKTFGYEMFLNILIFIEPLIFTFFILPPYFISKGFKTSENEPIYTLLYLAVTNLLVHQIGGVIIPEGLGLLFFGLSVLFMRKAFEDWRWMYLAMVSGFFTVMSHHLSVFQLFLFFSSLFLSYLYYYVRYLRERGLLRLLALILITIIILLVSSNYIWNLSGEDENTLILLFNMVTKIRLFPVILLAGVFLFPIAIVEPIRFLKKFEKSASRKTFILMPIIGMVLPSFLTMIFHPEALPTILWFTIPISLGFLPFAIYGIIQYCRKSTLLDSIFFMAPLTLFMIEAFFIISLENYNVLIHRLPTFVIYFATPLAGYGLSLFSKELDSIKKEYLAGMIIAYFIFSLAASSFPKPEFAYGVRESVSYSELKLAEDAYAYSILFNAKIDTDIRLGAVLMFTSHRRADWMGNLTSWFLPSNSWLVNVSVTGEPYSFKNNIIIMVSSSMREIYHGRVINLIIKPSGPLNEKVINYLNNCPGIDRLEDVQEGALYMKHPWKKLNQGK
ncbi:MAG: hypothetical protein FGF52_01395 [Candidatus Brockarchaeota archaeon]|nr:hypothetical protein [Candidatus Brockarchaeota archaeon]